MNENNTQTQLPLRPCVGIMVLNKDNKVFIGHRIGSLETQGSHFLWQMPQGGIDKEETPYQAAIRELYEETGIDNISLIKEYQDWLSYELPEHLIGIALKGRFRGQTQKWFIMRYEGKDEDINVTQPPEGHKAEFDQWRWEEIEKLPELIIPFKKEIYQILVKDIQKFLSKT